MRAYPSTESLGFLMGIVASSCGGGVTSDRGGSNDAASDASGGGNCASLDASDSGRPVPQVFASVNLGAYFDPNHNRQNTCSSFQSLAEVFTIGTATGTCDPTTGVCSNAGPARVRDCASEGGAETVNVVCSVKAGFYLNLHVSLGSTGSLSISGRVDGNQGGQMVAGDINYEGADYSSSNCSVTYTFMAQPVPEHPPITPGRIWAHLSCPNMSDPTGVRHKVLMDGSQVPDACDGEVDFIFENCAY